MLQQQSISRGARCGAVHSNTTGHSAVRSAMKALCGPPYPTHCRRGEETPHVTTPTSPQSAKRGTQTKCVVETLVIITMATNMYVSVLLVTDCERYNRPQRTLSASRPPTANRTAASSCQPHSGDILPTAQWRHLTNHTVAASYQPHCQEPPTQVYAAVATTPYDITDRLLIAGVELTTAYNLDHFLMSTNCGTVLKGNRSSSLIGTVGITFC